MKEIDMKSKDLNLYYLSPYMKIHHLMSLLCEDHMFHGPKTLWCIVFLNVWIWKL